MIAEPTGTDGLRYIGRTCHLFLLISFSQAGMIFSCTDILHLTRMIYSLTHNGVQDQTRIGKYPLLNGRPCFVGLSRANRFAR